MKTKNEVLKDKWLNEVWLSPECRRSVNLFQKVSYVLQQYSCSYESKGQYYGGFFGQTLKGRNHGEAVQNALNIAGFNRDLHFKVESVYENQGLIETLLSHLKTELGNSVIKEDGDLKAILDVINDKAEVNYFDDLAVPSFKVAENSVTKEEIKIEEKVEVKKTKEDARTELDSFLNNLKNVLAETVKISEVTDPYFSNPTHYQRIQTTVFDYINIIGADNEMATKEKALNNLMRYARIIDDNLGIIILNEEEDIRKAVNTLEDCEAVEDNSYKLPGLG